MDTREVTERLDRHEQRLSTLERIHSEQEAYRADIKELVDLLKQVKAAIRLFIWAGKALKWLAGTILIGYFFVKQDLVNLAAFFHSDTTR